MTKLVILDRDGVINQDSKHHIRSPEEWIPLPGSLEAIAHLNHFGFKVVVVTNQSGIERGLFSLEQLNAIHQKMRQALDRVGGQIDGIFFCPHTAARNCQCRKPKPGLMLEISDRLSIELKNIPVVGDSIRDLQSAWAVKANGILVKTGNGLSTIAEHSAELLQHQVKICSNLTEAAEYIISSARCEI
ncbi:hypothetical protein TI04_03415 [Achromatium sp. WMS2]|nr:hypothetical protein TI04_03415 [Achromatium sp. WMS2]